jgi:hypothetical protein
MAISFRAPIFGLLLTAGGFIACGETPARVNLSVVAVDSSGEPVTDLRADARRTSRRCHPV